MGELDRKEVQDLYGVLRTQWQTRNGEYELSRRRYNGEHWDSVTNPEPLNRYSLTLNYLKPFIDKSVQALVGRMPAIQVMPAGTDLIARRHAEALEAILYGTWEANQAPNVLLKVAWNSFVLRRGIIYVRWDPKDRMVRFKSITPEQFYPEYDGEEMWRVVAVSRRKTARLKAEFPRYAEDIVSDSEADFFRTISDDPNRATAKDQTTIIDVFDVDGWHTRMMGNAIYSQDLSYGFGCVPFVEFPCFPQDGLAEPLNTIDQLVEINQYLDQLVSQKADIISRYANPTILDFASGQSPEDIRRAVAAQGAVIPIRKDGNISLLNWQGTVPAIDQQIALIQDSLFDLAGKPRASFGQTVTNQSGIVTNLSLNPALQSNEAHETIWGMGLSRLNEHILRLWEKFMSGDQIKFRGRYGNQYGGNRLYDTQIEGKAIGGWYKNRIKWPSAIRTDDPVYVQNHLQLLNSPVPGLSLYSFLEEMGREDVEAEIDRITAQREDPRLHPEVMTAGVNAMTALQGQSVPGTSGPAAMMAPGTGGAGGLPNPAMNDSLEAAGNPDKTALVNAQKG